MFRTQKNTHVHFIGIGGIGMSGIAECLLDLGYTVSGSDLSRSENIERLIDLGARIAIGHRAENIEGATVVVYSSAVDHENPEVVKSHQLNIPLIRRAEMLAELMRLKFGFAIAGTHGKTTTTSFLATIFHECGLDPTYIIGGKVENLKGHAKVGKSEYLVAEADESDGSFLLLNPVMSVITNIDNDHLEHYQSFENLLKAFKEFANKIPFYGCLALNYHDSHLVDMRPHLKKPSLFFGIYEDGAKDVEIQARNVKYSDQHTDFDLYCYGEFATSIKLQLPGQHNVLNALGAIALAYRMELPIKEIARGVSCCHGVGRRFERIFYDQHREVIDDYGHHPSEILKALETARRSRQHKIVVIFEPHRFSRTKNCWDQFLDCFGDADEVILGQIYPASEKPIAGITSFELSRAIEQKTKLSVTCLEKLEDMREVFERKEEKVTYLILGAGSIGKVARKILAELKG